MCFGGGSSPDPRQIEANSEYNRLVGGPFKPGLEQFNDAVRRNAEALGYEVKTPDINDPNSFTATKQQNGRLSSLFAVNPKQTSLTNTYGNPYDGLRTGARAVSTYQVIR